ncbi:hypothetical protein ACIQVO_12185 [Streptomyces sp. NPDC101062]|uniref:hypothetical protein n=1 Tax=unclassified Streptomyces TaxID=2593676 RepID=UPI002E78E9B4|nr:hypothetical protein [Streptomyces sp. JV176]MEE1801220.1 hypothetical protein [Streptomyces sp. JV176]
MNAPDPYGATAVPGQEAERFVAASAVLTGFDAAELAATGMAEIYREFVTRRVAPPLYARLVDRLAGATADAHTALGGDAELGELARAVCHLWYLGEWPGLVGEDGGAAPCLVSGRAYARGLVWRTFGGHAPGTGRPGYGTWADSPAGVTGGGGR